MPPLRLLGYSEYPGFSVSGSQTTHFRRPESLFSQARRQPRLPKITPMTLNPCGFIGEEYLHGRNFATNSVNRKELYLPLLTVRGLLVEHRGRARRIHRNESTRDGSWNQLARDRRRLGTDIEDAPSRRACDRTLILSVAALCKVLPFGPILSYHAIWQE
jgi:hypothetical protein